jgi:hypothetical protein
MPNTNISEAKLEANRANAASSTGPRTPEGKQASRYNRLSHGLASPLTVLPFEDQAEYNNVLDSFRDDYQPIGATEESLVKQIADAHWKLRRLEKLETSVFAAVVNGSQNEPTEPSADPYTAMAATLLGPGKSQSALGLLARYQGTLNRQLLSCIKELRSIQRQRKAEYCERIKTTLLHQVAGFPNADDEHRLAFHLVAKDPTCLSEYNNLACDIIGIQSRYDRSLRQEASDAA